MKKITILLVIIFSFLFSTTSWGDWELVAMSKNGIKFYYDKDRVRKSGKFIYFWGLQDFIKPNKNGDLSATVYTELDCSILRFKWLNLQTYKNSMGEGEITRDFTPDDVWKYPRPKSTWESMYNYICEEHQKILGKLDGKKMGVLYIGERNGKFGYYTEKREGRETEDNIDYVKYEGEIKNGLPNGQGTVTYSSDGSKYIGEFKYGYPNGQGTQTWPDGRKYVGEWKNGEIWNGTYYDKNGNIIYKVVSGVKPW